MGHGRHWDAHAIRTTCERGRLPASITSELFATSSPFGASEASSPKRSPCVDCVSCPSRSCTRSVEASAISSNVSSRAERRNKTLLRVAIQVKTPFLHPDDVLPGHCRCFPDRRAGARCNSPLLHASEALSSTFRADPGPDGSSSVARRSGPRPASDASTKLLSVA